MKRTAIFWIAVLGIGGFLQAPTLRAQQIDSIIIGGVCHLDTVSAVIGSGGAADFTVISQTWPNALLTEPPTRYPSNVQIENLSNDTINIDFAWWSDTIHFKAVTTFPTAVPPSPPSVLFTIAYCPDSNSLSTHNSTQGNWFSPQVLEAGGKTESPRFDSLVGWAIAPSSVGVESNPSLSATIVPMDDGRALEIILPAEMPTPANFELVNVLGQSVLRATFPAGTQNVDASGLPRGVYFWRLTAGHDSQSGKVLLGE